MNRTALKTILLTIVALLSLSASAQRKKNVQVLPTTAVGMNSNDISKIHSGIKEGLSKLETINLLDDSDDGAESDLQIQCTIDSLTVYPRKDEKSGKTTYVTEIALTAKVYPSGKEELAQTYSTRAFSNLILASYATTRESAHSALSNLPEKVQKSFWKPFAVTGKVASIEESKNDKAKKVAVEIGTLSGAAQKQDFDIYLPDPLKLDKKGNLIENKPIGKVKVKDIGEEISVCEVKGGDDKIYAAYMENPDQLTAMSKKPSNGFIADKKYDAQCAAETIFIYKVMIEEAAKSVSDVAGSLLQVGKEAKGFVKEIF